MCWKCCLPGIAGGAWAFWLQWVDWVRGPRRYSMRLVDYLPGGWRALYVIAGISILYIAWLRRLLPESTLFDRYVERHEKLDFWQPVLEIYRFHWREMTAIALIAATF